jgi:predicted protein tyrosine phosphatase
VNILFICSRNQWRSPTAENIFKDRQGIQVRSAGTANSAHIRVSEKILQWADLIFVMEKKHKSRIEEKFPSICSQKEIVVLDIADEYQYMDEELIETLRASVEPYLK